MALAGTVLGMATTSYAKEMALVEFQPTESANQHIRIDRPTLITGTVYAASFTVEPGAVVYAVGEIEIVTTGSIEILGDMYGRDGDVAMGPDGSGIYLSSEKSVRISGTIFAGSGLNGAMPGERGGHGGDLTIESPLNIFSQTSITGARGGDAGPSAQGGDGGSIVITGSCLSTGGRVITIYGGDAGLAGDGVDGFGSEYRRGGHGGHGGDAHIIQDPANNHAGALHHHGPLGSITNLSPNPPVVIAPEIGTNGTDGTDGVGCESGSPGLPGGSVGGGSGTSGGTGTGGAVIISGDEGEIVNCTVGAPGGHGGKGGDATGGNGGKGGNAGDCCNPSAIPKSGGKGGKGGGGTGGKGGKGGRGGDGAFRNGSYCSSGGTGGDGGPGGMGRGGDGGNGGKGGKGCPQATNGGGRGDKGTGKRGSGGNPGAGGLPQNNGGTTGGKGGVAQGTPGTNGSRGGQCCDLGGPE